MRSISREIFSTGYAREEGKSTRLVAKAIHLVYKSPTEALFRLGMDLSGRRGLEIVVVLGGRTTESLSETFCEVGWVAETDLKGYLGDVARSGLKELRRPVQSCPLDQLAWGLAEQ